MRISRPVLTMLSVAALVACNGSGGTGNDGEGDLEAFVRLGEAQDLDYEPLRSPAQAVEKSAAIVVAHDLRVVAELEIENRDYPNVLIQGTVDETISGNVFGEFYIVHGLWDGADPETFRQTLPTTPVLLFLFDLEHPDAIQDELPGPSYEVAIDGMWFRTSDGDVVSGRSYVPKEEKESFWGPIESFDAMVQMMRNAAGAPALHSTPAPTNTIGPAPIFRGEVSGIELGVEYGSLPSCEQSEIAVNWERAVSGTFYDLPSPAGPARITGSPDVGVCLDDGRVIWIIAEYELDGGNVQISRWENVRWYPQEYPESRISTGTIAGRPAVLVDRASSGLGQTAVFVVDQENNGSTALLSSDFPLNSLRAIAEALYRPHEAEHDEAAEAGFACHGDPPKVNLTWFVGRTVDNLLCVRWEDRWENELGFELILTYPNESSERLYQLPPGTEEFIVPPDDQPYSADLSEDCLLRKDYSIEIRAVLPATTVVIGGIAASGECGQP